MNTDSDWLCLTGDWHEFLSVAIREGFEVGGSVPANKLEQRKELTLFTSFRRKSDDLNLIVTDSPEFAKKFLAATSVAKKLNLLAKADRIALFQAVLYGNSCQ